MVNKNYRIYAIPGWGFKTGVFKMLNNRNFNVIGLDYIQLSELPLVEIVQHIAKQIEAQSVLLGWSFGGLIAIKLAVLYPHKVKKLILFGCQPKIISSDDWLGVEKIFAINFLKGLSQNFNKQMRLFVHMVCYPNRPAVIRKTLKEYLLQESARELTSLLKLLFDADLREEYSKLKNNVLHFISEQDVVIPQNKEQLKKLNSHVAIEKVSGMGHVGFLAECHAFNNIIGDFINE